MQELTAKRINSMRKAARTNQPLVQRWLNRWLREAINKWLSYQKTVAEQVLSSREMKMDSNAMGKSPFSKFANESEMERIKMERTALSANAYMPDVKKLSKRQRDLLRMTAVGVNTSNFTKRQRSLLELTLSSSAEIGMPRHADHRVHVNDEFRELEERLAKESRANVFRSINIVDEM